MIDKGFHDIAAGKFAVVITYLEMHAAPAPRAVGLPDGVTFRQVTPTLDWYRDVFRRVGTDWLWFGRLKLTETKLREMLENPARVFYTLTQEGRDEALLELHFNPDGDCEVSYFGLTSALIGTGAGRYLMEQAIRLAWARPIKRLHLNTCSHDSPQALAFYRRSGFVPYKRQVEVDEDPRLTGLLPRDAAPQIPLIE